MDHMVVILCILIIILNNIIQLSRREEIFKNTWSMMKYEIDYFDIDIID